MAKHFLPRVPGAFYHRYPDIDIELEIANRQAIIARLADLTGKPFLLRETGPGSRHIIDQHTRASEIALKVRLSLASMTLRKSRQEPDPSGYLTTGSRYGIHYADQRAAIIPQATRLPELPAGCEA